MIAPRIALLAAALVLTPQAGLFAQQAPPVAPGDRVRVIAPTINHDPLVGTLVALGADTCVLEVEDRADPLALPLASVTRLEVSRGKKSNVGRSALFGGLAGAAAGALGALFKCEMQGPVWGTEPEPCSTGEVVQIIGVFVAAGAGFGALRGAVKKSDRWEEVPLDRLRFSVVPHRNGGLAIRVSVAF